MSKASGLGQFLLVGGVNLSGDIGSLSSVHGGPAPLDVTGIDKSAMERIGGVLDGAIEYTAFFNDAVGHSHAALSALPTTDVVLLYGTASTIGAAAAGMVGKELDYGGTRAQDGAWTFGVPNPANGYSLEWLDLLTAGLRTDTGATLGTAVDGGASSVTGWSAYLEVTAFTGTDVTVKLQDSADNVTFADVTAGGFTAITTAPTSQRIEGAAGATLRRYARLTTTTSGGVTSVTFAGGVTRHPVGAIA
jgi:hypothetical protein